MYIVVLAAVIHQVFGAMQYSNYQKTRVFPEKEGCSNSKSYHLIKQASRQSWATCGEMCSTTDHCRRFMFDSATYDCTLFKYGQNCFTHDDITNKVCFQQLYLRNESSFIRCQAGYYGDNCENIIEDCSDGRDKNVLPKETLLAFIKPALTISPFEVMCSLKYKGYTVLQNRQKNCESVNFERSWNEYVEGFGNKHGNFWLGLEPLHAILNNSRFFLVIWISFLGGGYGQAKYANFKLGNNSTNYKISIGNYSPFSATELGNALTPQGYKISGRPFSTYDRDYSNNNCPERFGGGWWYLGNNVCCYANLNGIRNASTVEESLKWEEVIGTSVNISNIHMKIARE